jgi:hypothetical protein
MCCEDGRSESHMWLAGKIAHFEPSLMQRVRQALAKFEANNDNQKSEINTDLECNRLIFIHTDTTPKQYTSASSISHDM